ncbi:MAG: hypothetical protein IJ068_02055 [Bacilli bacterium]|nr:hypothetical protein [Bacilli bacterium]
MKNEIFEKIELTIMNINKMQESFTKDIKISKIISYATYMYHTGYLDAFDYGLLLSKLSDKRRQDKIDNFLKNRVKNFIKYNNNLFSSFAILYNKYKDYDINYVNDYIDYKEISSSMIDFFKYLNIYDLFRNILNNKMIGKSSIIGESNLTINNYDDSYIVIGNFSKNNLLYYDLFVHEMGHAYVNNILKDKKIYNPNTLYKEIIPITFERLFIDYLKENDLLSFKDMKRLIINEETMRTAELSYAFKTCDIIKNHSYKLTRNDIVLDEKEEGYSFDFHYYAIANIVSINLLDLYKKDRIKFINNMPNIVNEISSITLQSLNKYYDFDLISNYLENNLASQKVRKIKM